MFECKIEIQIINIFKHNCIKIVTLQQAMKPKRGTRWRGISTSRPGRFTPRNAPVPTVQEAGWAPGPAWTVQKISPPTGI